jgi:hypothetical protein
MVRYKHCELIVSNLLDDVKIRPCVISTIKLQLVKISCTIVGVWEKFHTKISSKERFIDWFGTLVGVQGDQK